MHLLMQTNGDPNSNHSNPIPSKTPPSFPHHPNLKKKQRATQEKEVKKQRTTRKLSINKKNGQTGLN
jgi:hypothetical protein